MIEAKCKNSNCKHSWKCKSKMIFASCPSCGSKVKLRDKVEDSNDK